MEKDRKKIPFWELGINPITMKDGLCYSEYLIKQKATKKRNSNQSNL